MITVRHIERLWDARKYDNLLDCLLASRVESAVAGDLHAAGPFAAAAIGIIRLEELNQTHVPLFTKFLRAVIAAQQPDGGWGEVIRSVVCIKALLVDDGRGEAIERGMAWLAQLQQPGGIWPRIPLRRMPADAEVSAFVLMQLGDCDRFREVADCDAAINWFERNPAQLSNAAKMLWSHARLRCRVHAVIGEEQAWMWS